MIKYASMAFARIAAFLAATVFLFQPIRPASALSNGKILYPRLGSPAILKTGQLVMAVVSLPEGQRPIKPYLSPVNHPAFRVELAKPEVAFDEKGQVWRVTASVRPDIPSGLYDLNVLVRDERASAGAEREMSLYERRAVNVARDQGPPFSFVTLGNLDQGNEGGGKYPTLDFQKLRDRMWRDINRLEPDFVVVTGNIASSPYFYDRDYRMARSSIVENVFVPTLLVPGPGDVLSARFGLFPKMSGKTWWRRYIGLRYHSFDYGGYHIVCLDSASGALSQGVGGPDFGALDDAQYRWLVRDLEKASEAGSPVLVFCHHSPDEEFVEGGSGGLHGGGETMGLFEKSGVKYVFSSHSRKNVSRSRNGVVYISTGPAATPDPGEANGWGYREAIVQEDGTLQMRYVTLATKESPELEELYK